MYSAQTSKAIMTSICMYKKQTLNPDIYVEFWHVLKFLQKFHFDLFKFQNLNSEYLLMA